MGQRPTRLVPVHVRCALALALLLAGCGQGAPTEAYELSGRVRVLLESGDDGGPIEDAQVEFVSDTLIVESTRTDGDGRYRMRVMTDIDFGQVRANAEGFRTREESVYFDTPMRRVDLQLRRAPE